MMASVTEGGAYVICAYREWNVRAFETRYATGPERFHLISRREDLTLERLKALAPRFVFFLDWSWIVPKEIFTAYPCVVFHAAPLPEFRGGSPIQHQIVRGIRRTKLTAFLMDEGLDTGDVLLQEDLSLEGHLRDVMERIVDGTHRMVGAIVRGEYSRRPQVGAGSAFRRRTPAESEVTPEMLERSLETLYDFIRMLEDPYPNAFLHVGNKTIVFKEAELDANGDRLRAQVVIVERTKGEGR
jgi:methionyl-tRNA formyltransferase